jgi:hypothetical protein
VNQRESDSRECGSGLNDSGVAAWILYYALFYIRLLFHPIGDQKFSFTRETPFYVVSQNSNAIPVAVVKREVGGDGECISHLYIHSINGNSYLGTCMSKDFDQRSVLTLFMYQ